MSAVIALPLRAVEIDPPLVAHLRQQLAEREATERALRRAVERNATATMKALAATQALRDPYTAAHQNRVADVAIRIGRLLGMPADPLRGLEVAATLHDIGKLSVPTEILARPGPLSAVEHQLIRGHVVAGVEVLHGVEFPWPVQEVIWQHHERLDGTGYPRALKGAQILPEARILAIADVVDAMAAHRPYRPALGIATALAEIESGRGTRYDGDAVDACLSLFRDLGYRLPE